MRALPPWGDARALPTAPTRVRLGKSVILPRAVDYLKITKILYGVILSGAAQQAFPCHPERSGVAGVPLSS